MTVPQLFADSARRFGDRPLVDFMGRRFSYAQLHSEAAAFAAGLQRLGIAKGDRVGLFLPNVPIYVAAYYGAMLAGAVVVNFSPLYTAAELAAQVADSGARLLVTVDSSALLPTAVAVRQQSALEWLVVGSLADQLPWVKGLAMRLFARKSLSPVPGDALRWDDVLAAEPPRPVSLDPEEDLTLLQYTGGTTGTPKGAMLTHQNITANTRQVEAIDPQQQARDMIVGVLPLFHVFANICVLNRTMAHGGCIAMLPRFDAGQTLKTLARVKATAMPGVPTMYQALLDHPDCSKTDFTSLRICISGGAPLPLPLKQRFEAATGARLIDKEDPARDAPAGEPGELAIQGPQVMRGYWRRPEAAASAFAERPDGRWLRTGDVAVLEAGGYLRIVDRIKDMIAVGGFKVFPSQVEGVLLRHPAVKEALVIGVPDPYRGEAPRAYVTLQDGANETGAALANWLNDQLGKHERVDAVVVRESLPKTMIGKLDRKALRAELGL